MAETDRFERRFETALGRLADEVPTAVDAAAVARTIAAGEARRRGWLGRLVGPDARGLSPVLRFALAPALLLLLVLGLFALAQRIDPVMPEGPLGGRMTCEGAPWTSASGQVTLECVLDLPDAGLAGPVSITIGEGGPMGGLDVRPGTMELDASRARWTGGLKVTVAPNGMAMGDAVLVGEKDAGGLVLRAHIVSADGLRWGLLGWMEAAR